MFGPKVADGANLSIRNIFEVPPNSAERLRGQFKSGAVQFASGVPPTPNVQLGLPLNGVSWQGTAGYGRRMTTPSGPFGFR